MLDALPNGGNLKFVNINQPIYMKKLLLTTIISHFTYSILLAQYCGSSRYDTEVFTTVTTVSDVTYGSNTDLNGNTVTLKMDIYQPAGDTAAVRPLIVFAHGGSFIGGSKTDADQVTLCTRFAKRGYVTATINYRLGMGFPINQANAQKAVWRAVQDMKAAVRFFRKDAATTNTYKIDPNNIFVGGYSAGAFMAIHYAYLDQANEIPSAIDTNQLGGFEGNSGNPGYPSNIRAVLNLAGAVGDSTWIKPGDEPMATVQGNNDGTVPYCHAMIYVSGFPIMVVDGGGTMKVRSGNIGLENPIHTYYNGGHGAPVSPAANFDTSIVVLSDFTYKQLGCTPSNTAVYTNGQTCVTGNSIDEIALNENNVSIYPNPASDKIRMRLEEVKGKKFTGEVRDITGKIVREFEFSTKEFLLHKKDLPEGIYSLKLSSDENEIYSTKIIFTE